MRPGGGPELIADVTVSPAFGLDGVVYGQRSHPRDHRDHLRALPPTHALCG